MTDEEWEREWKQWREKAESDGRPVIEQITRAFAGVERGDGVSLHEADVIDDYGSDLERAEARLLDTDTRWQDVPDTDIERYNWILSFLDARGFRYYAPAYMVWAVWNIGMSDSLSTDFTIYSLALSGDSAMQEYILEKWSLFDTEQQCAICAFLRFMARYPGDADATQAEAALQNYWGKFCEPEAISRV